MTEITSSSTSSSERQWQRFSLALAIAAACFFIAVVAGSRYLPGQAGGYIPSTNIHGRIERVISLAIEPLPDRPCIVVLGDSRAAMNVNASALSSARCLAANYAYPAFSLAIQKFLLNEYADQGRGAGTVVLVASEVLFNVGPMKDFGVRAWLGFGGLAAFQEAFWNFRPTRKAILGVVRGGFFVRTVLSPSYRSPENLDWSSALGRWVYPISQDRVFHRQPNFAKELADHAADYYRRDFGSVQAELTAFVEEAKGKSRRFVMVIPPSHPAVGELAEKISPGKLETFWNNIRAVAARNDFLLVDCSDPKACGLQDVHFADAVHLNYKGAEIFSRFLAEKIGRPGAGPSRTGN